jgi:hypothetical protein
MQANQSRPEPAWQFYMTEGIALRALASVAKTEEVRDQLMRIAEMYDQLANFIKGSDAQAPGAQPS